MSKEQNSLDSWNAYMLTLEEGTAAEAHSPPPSANFNPPPITFQPVNPPQVLSYLDLVYDRDRLRGVLRDVLGWATKIRGGIDGVLTHALNSATRRGEPVDVETLKRLRADADAQLWHWIVEPINAALAPAPSPLNPEPRTLNPSATPAERIAWYQFELASALIERDSFRDRRRQLADEVIALKERLRAAGKANQTTETRSSTESTEAFDYRNTRIAWELYAERLEGPGDVIARLLNTGHCIGAWWQARGTRPVLKTQWCKICGSDHARDESCVKLPAGETPAPPT